MNKLTIAAAASLIAFSTANIATAGDCDFFSNEIGGMSYDANTNKFTAYTDETWVHFKASSDTKFVIVRQADKTQSQGSINYDSGPRTDSSGQTEVAEIWQSPRSSNIKYNAQFEYSSDTRVILYNANGSLNDSNYPYTISSDGGGITIQMPTGGASDIYIYINGSVTPVTNTIADGSYRVAHEIQCQKPKGNISGMSVKNNFDPDTTSPWRNQGTPDKAVAYWGPGLATNDPICEFTKLENGTMNLNPNGSWTLSQPAEVGISYININQIDIDPQNGGEIVQVNGSAVFDAEIDYTGSTVDGVQVANNDISITGLNNAAGSTSIEIRGEATPIGTVVYDANTTYRVRHVITCTQ